MPTPDQTRLAEDRARPRIMDLWWALRPLTSVVRFMQSGAHPDDEVSGLLAALAFRDGLNLSYVCSTRGEGGQNDIGTESGADLGALRTREMERAADILSMRLYWLSEGPDDPITDFGFSKSGEETLQRWGRARTLERLVTVVRTERPDILMPTFLDVPGQHGHHRAMTRAAHEVMTLAADPAFPSNLPVWQVKKLYLPAWSGAGQAYDDTEPPPPATLTVDGAGGDPVSGWSWERIGQHSRAFHRTQGMGRWIPPGIRRDWPLHLADSHVPGPDTSLVSGLPRTLSDLAALTGARSLEAPLAAASHAIDRAVAAFPDTDAIAAAAAAAFNSVRDARDTCPPAAQGEILHRLEGKEIQLANVLRLSRRIEARAYGAETMLAPGQKTSLTVDCGGDGPVTAEASLDLPAGWTVSEGVLSIADDAAPSDPYPVFHDPAAPRAPALLVRMGRNDRAPAARLPVDAAPVILPARAGIVAPDAALLNLEQPDRRLSASVSDVSPSGARAGFDLPDGWRTDGEGDGITIEAPADVAEGLFRLPLLLDGAPARTVRRMTPPHVEPTARSRPADLRVRVLRAAVPDARVGYVGSGHDQVAHWLAAMGADVRDLSGADIECATVLGGIDTLVIGIFALRFRAGLAAAMPRVNDWVRAGGTLVTLYHRPWDNWDPDTIPPKRLEIGQPSLRWRVTDEAAAVHHLADHPVLSRPNRIAAADWDGWVKERGLYFAKSWDDAYFPLVEMADPGKSPHRGALLAADVGRGRHVHTSLILHHQMANLVPGAFRLMANLIAPRE